MGFATEAGFDVVIGGGADGKNGIPVRLTARGDSEGFERFLAHLDAGNLPDLKFGEFLEGFLDATVKDLAVSGELLKLSAEINSFDLDVNPRKGMTSFGGSFAIVADKPKEGEEFRLSFDFFLTSGTSGGIAFGLSMDTSSALSFGNLPLVGRNEEIAKLGIRGIGIVYASAAGEFEIPKFDRLGQQLPAGQGGGSATAAMGFSILASFGGFEGQINNLLVPLNAKSRPALPMGGGSITTTKKAAVKKAAAKKPKKEDTDIGAGDGLTWLDLDKAFGPVTLARLGFGFGDGRVTIAVSGSFSLASFALELEGLGVSTELFTWFKDPGAGLRSTRPTLLGMGLEIRRDPLEISGAFLRFGEDYLGMARVKVSELGLSAIGGYAPAEKSFFIFVRVEFPIGGPPFFFVTGLAGGLGINRRLTIPAIDELHHFPLLPQNNNFPTALPGDKSKARNSIMKALRTVGKYIRPCAGQYWVAAGIDFSSFEMVKSSVLVTVSFGVELEIALLGVSRISIPPKVPTSIAYLEVTIAARFNAGTGILAIDGRVTPASYLFAGLCRISGGFAFYLWFKNYQTAKAGDFVVSIGGYHPRFMKPAHYPAVPRMAIGFEAGPLVIKGEAYIALTPHMLMAGIAMKATFELAMIRAWFIASFDFLIGWKPFEYLAEARVRIGVEARIPLLVTTISIHVSVAVDLVVWGPPFGGKAIVDLDIVSFAIDFGEAQQKKAINWDEFKDSFLPAAPAPKPKPKPRALASRSADPMIEVRMADEEEPEKPICSLTAGAGLVEDLKSQDETSTLSWILDPNHFELKTNSVIPSKTAKVNGDNQTGKWSTDFGVLPLQLKSDQFKTRQEVTLTRMRQGGNMRNAADFTGKVPNLKCEPVLRSSESALWATKDGGLNGDRLIEGTLAGFRLSPSLSRPASSFKADLQQLLFDNAHNVGWFLSTPVRPKSDPHNAQVKGAKLSFDLDGKRVENVDYKLTALTRNRKVNERREEAIKQLNELDYFDFEEEVDLLGMTKFEMDDWPMIRTIGAEIPA